MVAGALAGVVACGGLAAASGCSGKVCNGMSAPTPKESPLEVAPSPPPDSSALETVPAPIPASPGVQFVAEMEPFPGGFGPGSGPSAAEKAGFETAWTAARGLVADRVTPAELVAISRWAREQTRSAALPTGWIEQIPMTFQGRNSAGVLLFSQSAEESPVDLPTHAAVVRRRLIVAAAYDPAAPRITDAYITIRGWAEE
jgi:hypothetical protein